MSRSSEAIILARSGPLFLMDLAFRILSVREAGLRDISCPSNSNNKIQGKFSARTEI